MLSGLIKIYDEISKFIAKAILANSFFSLIFGGFCIVIAFSFLINIEKEISMGGIFTLLEALFGTLAANLISGLILLFAGLALIYNAVNKKWPNIDEL